jgi:hypothetical protein
MFNIQPVLTLAACAGCLTLWFERRSGETRKGRHIAGLFLALTVLLLLLAFAIADWR